MGIDAAITVGFNLLLIGVGLTLSLFVSINIPLIVFDKSIHVFNILSGGNLLNDVIFSGGVDWSVDNIFFVTYLTLAIVSIFVVVVLIVKNNVKDVYDFGSDKKSKRKNIVKSLLTFIFSLFLTPMVFFLINSLSVLMVPIFSNYVSKSTEPFSTQQMVDSINIALNKSMILKNNVGDLINSLIKSKDDILKYNIMSLDTFNTVINRLKDNNNTLDELISSLNTLKGAIINTKLTSDNIYLLNKSYIEIINISNGIKEYFNYNFDFDISIAENGTTIFPFQNIYDLEQLLSKNTDSFNMLKMDHDSYYRLDKIAWTNNWSTYKTNYLTLKITHYIFGYDIYDLYNPIISVAAIGAESIASIFNGQIFFLIIKIALFIPTISIISGIMFTIVINLFKRIIELIYLLVISPIVSSTYFNDDGEKWKVWFNTCLSKFFYVGIASLALSVYKIILPILLDSINLINSDLSGANKNDIESMRLIIAMAVIIGSTYGLKTVISTSSSWIGESSLENDGVGIGSRIADRHKRKTDKRIQNRTKALRKPAVLTMNTVGTKIKGKLGKGAI